MSVALKRFWILYRNGGYEDEWAFARVFNDVVDINTKISITGLVMRKTIDGKWEKVFPVSCRRTGSLLPCRWTKTMKGSPFARPLGWRLASGTRPIA